MPCTGPDSILSINTEAAAHLRQHGLHDGIIRCDLGTAGVDSWGPGGGPGCLLAALCPNGIAVGLRLRLAAGCRAGESVRLLCRLSHLHRIPRQHKRVLFRSLVQQTLHGGCQPAHHNAQVGLSSKLQIASHSSFCSRRYRTKAPQTSSMPNRPPCCSNLSLCHASAGGANLPTSAVM